MAKKNQLPVLLPETAWNWQQVRVATQKAAVDGDARSALNVVGVIALATSVAAGGWANNLVIFGVPATGAFITVVIGYFLHMVYGKDWAWHKKQVTDYEANQFLKGLVESRCAKLTDPKTAPGRAKAAYDDTLKRWHELKQAGLSDPADRQAYNALGKEVDDLKATGGYQAYLEIEAAKQEMLQLIEHQVRPRLKREMLLTPERRLTAAERITQSIGLRTRIAAAVTTDRAVATDERHRVAVAALGNSEDLDTDVTASLRSGRHL